MSVRTTQPNSTNKYYLTAAGGGYNKCILGNANNKYNARPASYSVLPNCVGYAYGRYLEYWGLKSANLPTCNAKDWDNVAKANGFNVSKTPSVGSVIVFEGTECGHVAFVEEIKSNGDLLLSESNWSYSIFRNVTVKKANDYRYSSTLKCVGFVANPNAPKPKEPEKPKYTTGDYIVNTELLHLRTGAGTEFAKKTFSQLSANAQSKIKKLNGGKGADGYVKGVTFTVSEVKKNTKDGYTWGKTPSGWVALDYCKKI